MNSLVENKNVKQINRLDTLVFLSVIYLLLPNLLFILFWFKWWIVAIVFLLTTIVSYNKFFSLQFNLKRQIADFFSSKYNLILLTIAILMCTLTGVGLFLPQGDLPKHHAIIKILVEQTWPVTIIDKGETLYLVYYFAWYLPAALLGKIAGFNAAFVVLFVESVIGLYLTLCWVLRLSSSKKSVFVALAIFFLLDGQDTMFIFFKYLVHYIFEFGGSPRVIYDITWQISYFDLILRKFSVAFDLTFVPQQALAAWLATGLLMEGINRKDFSLSILVMATSALWSVLCTIGLLPILFYGIFIKKAKGLFSNTNLLLGLPLGFLSFFYFLSHFPIDEQGWLWNDNTTDYWFLRWPSFVIFEFGLYAVIMYWKVKKIPIFQLWLLCNFCLLVLSLYVFGLYNDLLMRASIPLHFIFVLATISFYKQLQLRYKKQLLVLFLVTCSCSFFLMIAHLHYLKWQVGLPTIQANDVFENMEKDDWFQRQYLGDSNSFYGKFLSK